jgi:hypothetical protein
MDSRFVPIDFNIYNLNSNHWINYFQSNSLNDPNSLRDCIFNTLWRNRFDFWYYGLYNFYEVPGIRGGAIAMIVGSTLTGLYVSIITV